MDSKKIDVNPAVTDAAKRAAARQLSARSRRVADTVLNSQAENINALEDNIDDEEIKFVFCNDLFDEDMANQNFFEDTC